MQPNQQGNTHLPFGEISRHNILYQRVLSNERIHTPDGQFTENQAVDQNSVCDYCTVQGITQLLSDKTRLEEELHQSKQMILRLVHEADTCEQNVDRLEENLHILKEKLKQTKADHERNQGRNVSVNNFHGTLHVLHCSSKDMALQFGNQNLMMYLAENVQHNPWES